VRDVLSGQECQDTVDDMWGLLERTPQFQRNDPSTWDYWTEDGMAKHGMPSRPPVFSKPALRNRQNPNVHAVFSTILGTDDLLVNHDRYGLFRPTKNVQFSDGARDVPKWKTSLNLHLDMDPWGFMGRNNKALDTLNGLKYGYHLNHFIFENNQISYHILGGLHLQGVLNLMENFEEDGGFQVVPGFKNHFEQWLQANSKGELVKVASERNSYNFDAKDPIQKYSIRVPMRAGSMVIWDQRMPHGARPNNSDRLRCAQFIKMFPASPIDFRRASLRANTIQTQLNASGFQGELTQLGQKVFGLTLPENQSKEVKKEKKEQKKPKVQGSWSKKN